MHTLDHIITGEIRITKTAYSRKTPRDYAISNFVFGFSLMMLYQIQKYEALIVCKYRYKRSTEPIC